MTSADKEMTMLGEYILGQLSRDPAAGDYLNEGFESSAMTRASVFRSSSAGSRR
jgi:hypothetical protein